jgi:hypothetical protein
MKFIKSFTDSLHDGLPFLLPEFALDLEDII